MWNVLQFTYRFEDQSEVRTKIQGHLHLEEAETMFDHLRLAYRFDAPLKIKGGKRIRILSVSLFSSFREDRGEAEMEVRNGIARLIEEAHPLEIDLDA